MFQGRYTRFDRFQDDMFDVFEFARKASSVDSQVEHVHIDLLLYTVKTTEVPSLVLVHSVTLTTAMQ